VKEEKKEGEHKGEEEEMGMSWAQISPGSQSQS
jgi:hypothetical protein